MSTQSTSIDLNEDDISEIDSMLESSQKEATTHMVEVVHASEQSSSTSAPSTVEVAPPAGDFSSAFGAIVIWIATSCSVIIFNKYLFSTIFPFPLTLVLCHMGFATVVTTILKIMGKLTVPNVPSDVYKKSIIPIGGLLCLALATSNVAALRLSVSFVQMVKALTPLLTLGLSVMMGLETASRSLFAIVTLLTVGVMIAASGEVEFNFFGFVLQLLSLVFESLRLVLAQMLLQQYLPPGTSPLVSISLFAPISFLFLIPIVLFFEPNGVSVLFGSSSTLLTIILNTVVAFSLNVAVINLVTKSSGLVLTLAGIVKDVVIIIASVVLLGSFITYLQIGGYLIALYGLNCFNLYKQSKGDISLRECLFRASHNQPMLVMTAGMLLLLIFAQ